MTCRDAIEFIADYLDGKLPVWQQVSFSLHLSFCRPCRDYLDSYRKTIEASRNALADQLPREELPEELVQAILATRKQDPRVD